MADPPSRESATRPAPPLARGEDSPPGQYRPLPEHIEHIARIALRAPPVPAVDPQQELLRAIAATEGRMLVAAKEEEERQNEFRAVFEAKMRQEIQKLVVHEVRSVPPPPPPPVLPKARLDWTHLQYVTGFIVALSALIALILGALKPSAEVLKRFDALDKSLSDTNARLAAHKLSDYEYKLSVRSWVTDVFERASGVKIDDPPGTPPRDPLGFYPTPKIDPHKVPTAHPVQPRDPYPVPAPP